jgi:hypothetical protein
MAYEDWDEEFRDVFDDIPGVPLFRDYEYEIAQDLFERGFTHHADEPGYDREEAQAAREEFFEFTGLPDELFPWDEWREAMGYDE